MPNERDVKILLADDHVMVRKGLRRLLEAEPGLTVVGEAGSGTEVLDLCERFQPDIVVSDLIMPEMGGIEIIRRVRMLAHIPRVIILSMHDNEIYVLEALTAGASAFVLKDESPEDLAKAVREVAQGNRYLSPRLSERAIQAYVTKGQEAQADIFELLSDREREVLFLAAEGLTNVQIGERLSISPRTVEIHRSKLMRKLGLKNQAELVRFALRRGILHTG